MSETKFSFIDTQEGVDRLVEGLSGVSELALDSEADNLHHYDTRLCLAQIRFDENIYLLDVLAEGLDLSGFWGELSGKLLIMHGSDFDLRLFKKFANFRPSKLFDSMLAAQLLGSKRIGLAALLEDYFEIKLPKDSQKSDWSQRPLTDKMLDYAAKDVLYLHELRDLMMNQIRELGREDWLHQRCEYQIETANSGFPEPDENAWRISRSDKLDDKASAALYELWHWREDLAAKLDRPPFKVLGNDYLLSLSESVSEGNWKFVFESLPMGIRRRKRQGLVEALEKGVEKDPGSLPRRVRKFDTKGPLTQHELERQEKIKNHRNRVAESLDIDPTLIATRSVVAQLAREPENLIGMLAWQRDLMEPCLSQLDAEE